jgi:hypothetical protein
VFREGSSANFLISQCHILCGTRRQSPPHTRPDPALRAAQASPQGHFLLGKSFRGHRLSPAVKGSENPKVTSTRPSGSARSSRHNSSPTKLVWPVHWHPPQRPRAFNRSHKDSRPRGPVKSRQDPLSLSSPSPRAVAISSECNNPGAQARTPTVARGSPGAQCLPRGVDVSVEILFGGLAGAHTIARVVVREDVAVDARAQADVEATHLAQVHGVAVREEQRVAAGGRAAHEHAAQPVVAGRAREEDLDGVQFALRVLPVGALAQVQAARAGARTLLGRSGLRRRGGRGGRRGSGRALLGRQHRVGGFGRQEGQLGGDAARTRRAAEEPAQLAEREAVHPGAGLGHRGGLAPAAGGREAQGAQRESAENWRPAEKAERPGAGPGGRGAASGAGQRQPRSPGEVRTAGARARHTKPAAAAAMARSSAPPRPRTLLPLPGYRAARPHRRAGLPIGTDAPV